MHKWIIGLLLAVGCTGNPGTNGDSIALSNQHATGENSVVPSSGSASERSSVPADTLDVSGHGVVVRLAGHWFDLAKATTYWEDNMAKNLFVIDSIDGDLSKSGQQIQLVGENVPEVSEVPVELVGYFFLRRAPFGLIDGLEAHEKSQGHGFRYELMFSTLKPDEVSSDHFKAQP